MGSAFSWLGQKKPNGRTSSQQTAAFAVILARRTNAFPPWFLHVLFRFLKSSLSGKWKEDFHNSTLSITIDAQADVTGTYKDRKGAIFGESSARGDDISSCWIESTSQNSRFDWYGGTFRPTLSNDGETFKASWKGGKIERRWLKQFGVASLLEDKHAASALLENKGLRSGLMNKTNGTGSAPSPWKGKRI